MHHFTLLAARLHQLTQQTCQNPYEISAALYFLFRPLIPSVHPAVGTDTPPQNPHDYVFLSDHNKAARRKMFHFYGSVENLRKAMRQGQKAPHSGVYSGIANQLFDPPGKSTPPRLEADRFTNNHATAEACPEEESPIIGELEAPGISYQGLIRDFPREEIRVIVLEPLTPTDEIRCTVVAVDMWSVSYEALSYEWGAPSPLLPIFVNGVKIVVRTNLFWALRNLRLKEQVRVLWIDVLCINQRDVIERSDQVARMGQIYSRANRCIAWIGRERIFDPEGGQISDCGPAMRILENDARGWSDGQGKDYCLTQEDLEDFTCIESLCQRGYWNRLWIIQEIVLSRYPLILCDNHEAEWQALASVFLKMKLFMHPPYHFPIAFTAAYHLYNETERSKEKRKVMKRGEVLIELVTKFKESLCVDPRDKMFGLIGLARLCCVDAVKTNYAGTTEQICISLILHHLSHHLDHESTSFDTVRELCLATFAGPSEMAGGYRNDARPSSPSARASPSAGRAILLIPIRELRKAMVPRTTPHFPRTPHESPFRMRRPHVSSLETAFQRMILPKKNIEARNIIECFVRSMFFSIHHMEMHKRVYRYYYNERLEGTQSLKVKHREDSGEVKKLASWFDGVGVMATCGVFVKEDEHLYEVDQQNLELVVRSFGPDFIPTHLFLTDMSFVGIAEADLSIGTELHKVSSKEWDLKVQYKSPSGMERYCVCLDKRTTIQDLVSWLVE